MKESVLESETGRIRRLVGISLLFFAIVGICVSIGLISMMYSSEHRNPQRSTQKSKVKDGGSGGFGGIGVGGLFGVGGRGGAESYQKISPMSNYVKSYRGKNQTVILLLIDGMTEKVLDRMNSFKLLDRLNRGNTVIFRKVHPVFPFTRYPNYYSLITGVNPGEHGVINNVFYDKNLGVDIDAENFYLGRKTIWDHLKVFGRYSASSEFPGTDGENGRTIAYKGSYDSYDPFFGGRNIEHQVNDVLSWACSTNEAPSLIMAHFSLLDAAARSYGNNSPGFSKALVDVDLQLNRMFSHLYKEGVLGHINIVAYGGVGLSDVYTSDLIYLDDIFSENRFVYNPHVRSALKLVHKVHTTGTVAYVTFPGFHGKVKKKMDRTERILLKYLVSHLNRVSHGYTVLERAELLKYYPECAGSYGNTYPAVVLIAKEGYYFVNGSVYNHGWKEDIPFTTDGYGSAANAAALVLHGNRVLASREMGVLNIMESWLQTYSVLDIYPLIMRLLGLVDGGS